jgi:hypothetical protein
VTHDKSINFLVAAFVAVLFYKLLPPSAGIAWYIKARQSRSVNLSVSSFFAVAETPL